jgi:hypothetical protein
MPFKASDRFPVFMRRLTSFFGITLLALLVSGWSNVLAAAICPKTPAMAACPMQTGNKPTSSHEAMEMGEIGDMQMTPAVAEDEANALEQPMGSCPHCFKQPEQPSSPVVASKGAEQSKRDPGTIIRQAFKVITPQTATFAPPVSSRQHAPPQASTPRHVLINVFLI